MTNRGLLPRGLIVGIAVFFAIVLAGCVGLVLDGYSLVDALFTAVTAVTTVGYFPARPLSAGAKIFLTVLILGGVGTGVYVFGSLTEYLIGGSLLGNWQRRRVFKKVEEMHDHYIICGFGRVGQRVATQFEEAGVTFVVIDNNSAVIAIARERGLLFVEGDATTDPELEQVGVKRARGLLACADSDVKNVYITLSARALNPALFIVARASDANAERNLYNAGASRVVSPYTMAGNRMAHLATQPLAADYTDIVLRGRSLDVQIEERGVIPGSRLANRTVGDIRSHELAGGHILAVEHDGRLITFVGDNLTIVTNDRILVAGTAEQMAAFDSMV